MKTEPNESGARNEYWEIIKREMNILGGRKERVLSISFDRVEELEEDLQDVRNVAEAQLQLSQERVQELERRVEELESGLKLLLTLPCAPDGEVWDDLKGIFKSKDKRIIKDVQKLLTPKS